MRGFFDDSQKAKALTTVAQEQLSQVSSLLRQGLALDHCLEWADLKDRTSFPDPKPVKPLRQRPECDEPLSTYFQRPLTLIDWLLPPLRKKKQSLARKAFENAHTQWTAMVREADLAYQQSLRDYEDSLTRWQQKRQRFYAEQGTQHSLVEKLQLLHPDHDAGAVEFYCRCVMERSEYPKGFPNTCSLEYLTQSKTLVCDHQLPHISQLPSLKEVKYIASKNEFRQIRATASWLSHTYDDVLYQIALRNLWELFQSDRVDAIDTIVFNGWVAAIDKATGKDFEAVVLSVQSSKSEFLDLNLANVDPKSCFKKLKGISGSKLAEVVPVRPILEISREDRRFVQGYAVADGLSKETNLAAMDWLDFENLIRELFHAEFSKNGGEVKITQASRDGGVDAIAFDPDPIRGGKIVIQAKRYTNTVSVSAVRDLYGTLLNEGATKGILVTTADYGRDAYEFAKDKPITLLSGSELLHLLLQHGHRARIDLTEARSLERGGRKG